jgi:hypothetical protein
VRVHRGRGSPRVTPSSRGGEGSGQASSGEGSGERHSGEVAHDAARARNELFVSISPVKSGAGLDRRCYDPNPHELKEARQAIARPL